MSEFDTLREQVALLGDDLATLDGRELGERLQNIERLTRQLERVTIEVVRESDRRVVWAEDGHRSVRGWCRSMVNWSYADTTHRLRSVTLLDDLGECGELLADGSLGVAQVRELARARANPRCGEQLVDAAEVLVPYAQSLPYEEFRRVVQRWEMLADVDGAHRDHDQVHEARTVSFEPVGESWQLRASGGAAQGASMREIFDAFCEAEFLADWDDAKARCGDNATASDLARTAGQRRFDALHALFLTAASVAPGSKAPEPQVNIVVDETTFEAALTAMLEDRPLSDVIPPVTDPTTRRCETLDGDPIDPYDAVSAAFIGHVRRVVFDSKSCTINLGVSSRLFRGLSRLAVWLQGTRCIWPGCGLRHCQIDHTTPWGQSGVTDQDNAGPLCGFHNRWKTRGFHVWRDPEGHWHTYRPDHTEIAAA